MQLFTSITYKVNQYQHLPTQDVCIYEMESYIHDLDCSGVRSKHILRVVANPFRKTPKKGQSATLFHQLRILGNLVTHAAFLTKTNNI